MTGSEIIVFALILLCGLALAAQRLKIASPIAFLFGGVAIGFSLRLPDFPIPAHAILPIFLPPLLMEAAYFTTWRDFKANARPISQLAIGLVIATTAAVAALIKLLFPDVPWAAAIALGAIVAPPDAVATVSILKTVRVPRRIIAILEGESLVNDASSLVIYQFAVAALLTGFFSAPQAGAHFIYIALMGPAIGWLCARIFIRIFPYLKDTSIEILMSFLLPYAAYLLAELAHASGVLAVVTAGLVLGWHGPTLFSPRFRMTAESVWQMVVFILNALVFVLIGLALPSIISRLSYTPQELALYSAALVGTVIFVRMIWVPLLAYGWRFLRPKIRARDPYPPWQNVFLIGWAGMRGVVTLAAALALPLTIDGAPFAERDIFIFLAFVVIAATLLGQGLPLPWLVRKLKFRSDYKQVEEEWLARKKAVERALVRVEQLTAGKEQIPAALARICEYYSARLSSLGDGPSTPLTPDDLPRFHQHPLIHAEHESWQDVLTQEKQVVLELRRNFEISDEVMRLLLQEIDLMAIRFGYSNVE